MADIEAAHLAALNAGTAEARTLTEALAIDHVALLRAAIAAPSAELVAAASAAQQLGILKRMTAIGAALAEQLEADELARLASHSSDTVRGWWCFAVAAAEPESIRGLLETVKPLADDERFTVREWVWMAVRPRLVSDLDEAIAQLVPWVQDPSPRVRRFATESLRPRGVWASHIAALKTDPGRAVALLDPLRADPSVYVQDSVANWINDASKSAPDWARALCARWAADSSAPETARIISRALRTIGATK